MICLAPESPGRTNVSGSEMMRVLPSTIAKGVMVPMSTGKGDPGRITCHVMRPIVSRAHLKQFLTLGMM